LIKFTDSYRFPSLTNYTAYNNEVDLFVLISQGDEAAFEQLFKLYVPRIQPVILQIVRSDAVVKDIVQEVFLHLWLGRDKLAEITEPRHWIFRITYNRSFLYMRKKLLQEKTNARLSAQPESALHLSQTEDSFDFAETTRLVQAAIAALPPQAKKIYELSRMSGMRPADVAEQLGISTQSVRNSLTRSGKDIKEYLGRNGTIIPLVILFIISS